MEYINLKLIYRSQSNNGWPLIMIKVNDNIVERFHADSKEWSSKFAFEPNRVNTLKIEHYGKNYITDQSPDKFFELEKCYINGVDLKHHIHLFRQTAFLPPWDNQSPPDYSLYLGHNGYLKLEFESPTNNWLQSLFGVTPNTMHGQQTTKKVLREVKDFFGFNS